MKLSAIYFNLRLIFMTVVGLLTSVMMVLLLSPLLLAFWIFAKIVYFLIFLKIGNTFTRPGGLDITQGMESYQSRPYCHAIGRYKGKIDLQKFRSKFMDILKLKDNKGNLRYKKFTQVFKKMYGYHIYRDSKNFDIANHIKKIEMSELFPEKFTEFSLSKNEPNDLFSVSNITNGLNTTIIPENMDFKGVDLHTVLAKEETQKLQASNNEEKNEKEINNRHQKSKQSLPKIEWELILERLLTKYGCSPIENDLPQWQILAVEENGYYTLVFKLHHSFSDGIYLLRFYLEHLGDKPVECRLPYNYYQSKYCRKFLDCFWAFCLLPFGLSRLSFSYEKNPLHGPQLSGDKMYLISTPIPMNTIKEIKRQTQASMNAIFFSCMSNAIASHFKKKKCSVENVIVLVPVSLQDLSKEIKLRNEFGLTGILLPTFVDRSSSSIRARNPTSAVARLHEVQASCNRTKSDPSFLAIHWMLVFVCSLLPSDILRALFKTKGMTTSLSNIAGPSNGDLYIGGCKKCDFCFFIPDRNPLGMGVSVAGFEDQIRIGLMIDRVLMATETEGYEFLEAFKEEVTNLSNEVRSSYVTRSLEFEDESSFMIETVP